MGAGPPGAGVPSWSSTAWTPGVGVSGEVFNMTAGFDYETGPVLAGLALAGSVGTGDYHVAPTGVQSERMGEIWSLLGSVHPYVHVSLAEWLRVWGLGGIGSGTLRISGSEQDADLHMRMWAFGGRSDLRVPALDDLRFALPETPSARHFRRPGSGPGISRRCRIRRFAERWSGCARRGPIPQPCWPSRFLVLTACRSGEVRGARWEEMDLEAREWRIPAERMKANRDHRVPLSTGALAVLRVARSVADGSELVFPSVRGRALSDATLSKMVRDLGIGAVPHGFRSSFRDWAAECSDAPREVCELALAHVNSDRVEAAYRRTDLFERRRELMEEWAGFLGRS